MPYKLKKVRGSDLYYVINTETGHRHSMEPMTKKMANRQLRAIYANYKGAGGAEALVKGGGLRAEGEEKAGSVCPMCKAGMCSKCKDNNGVCSECENGEQCQDCIEGGGIMDFLKSIPGRLSGFISGKRYDYQPNDRTLMAEIGNQIVNGICVYRVPLDKNLNKAVNAITLGKFQDFKKNNNYDDMFHLYAVAILANGVSVKFEKNEVINLDKVDPATLPQGQYKLDVNIENGQSRVSFKQMLDKTQAQMGNDRYWNYNPLSNNCQNFIYGVMLANNWININPQLKDFILQPIGQLEQQLSSAQKGIMSGITKLGTRFNILVKGKGFDVLNTDDTSF